MDDIFGFGFAERDRVFETIEHRVDRGFVLGIDDEIAVAVELVGQPGHTEHVGQSRLLLGCPLVHFVHGVLGIGIERGQRSVLDFLDEIVDRVLVDGPHDHRRPLPRMREAGAGQQLIEHAPALERPVVEFVRELFFIGRAHVFGGQRSFGHQANTALDTRLDAWFIFRAALETPQRTHTCILPCPGGIGPIGSSLVSPHLVPSRPMTTAPDRNLALELVRTTEAAAIAASRWMGRGDKNAADNAAVEAMRTVLHSVSMNGVVVIGEGEKDEAPMLYNGEAVGDGSGSPADVAVDPIDGTTLTSLGRGNALAVIAVSDKGTMFDPGPCVYMEKIAVGPAGKGLIDIEASATEHLRRPGEPKA